MKDFITVVNAILGGAQHLYNMASENASFFLYPLYAAVAGFFIYLLVRFITRL